MYISLCIHFLHFTMRKKRTRQNKKAAIRADFDTVKAAIHGYLANDDWQAAMLLAVPLFTGLRVSEWQGLRWENILQPSMEIGIKKDRGVGKTRTIEFSEDTKAIFRRCYELSGTTHPPKLIFRSKFNRPYCTLWLNKLVEQVCEEQGWEKYTTHSFRKSWGYKMWQILGANHEALLLLQMAFNHSSPHTTMIYLGLREDVISKAMKML